MTRGITAVKATIVAIIMAGALAFAGATAAQASVLYPPVDACGVADVTVSAGDTISFSCQSGTFAANEAVTITVTGENGADATFAFVRMAISTGSATYTSSATGTLPAVSITLPADAKGIYNIAAVSSGSAGGIASVTIVAADGLPTTGGDSGQLLGIWIGGGALVLAGVVVLVAVLVRRRNDARDL
ncbi:MAG: cell wall protein [Microbacterium sp. SCN 70-200]|uniref:cell wall protein n=1 Tax=unclassified Microbacterium TaxID=2609290 RepID=UPI00086F34E1|nr:MULTISPECIES: cell wall protein [unclassified Microbacterium]MBN9216098.1 cell wall protein [Microbacterium sp.]ODT39837.1 MAG: cell wall protein [Microbacterium sp. SCN 70-200]OJV80576.1 MAG: cell wall protein [Microbacterium sp. 70-16]